MTSAEPLRAHLVLASRFENIEVAERTLLDLCQHTHLDGDEEYWILTALREAVANAVRHGNRAEPDLKVRVDLAIENSTITIVVEDQGDGFEPSEVPDPTNPENLLRPSGRGIFYMQQFMNQVEFSRAPDGGTRVLMVKELKPSSRSEENEIRNP